MRARKSRRPLLGHWLLLGSLLLVQIIVIIPFATAFLGHSIAVPPLSTFQRPQTTTTTTTTATATAATRCNLFFRQREEDALLGKRQQAQARIPVSAFEDLRQGISFPYTFTLASPPNNSNNDGDGDTTDDQILKKQRITLRWLTLGDLSTIVPMCATEFGSGETTTLEDLWRDVDWWQQLKRPHEIQEHINSWWEDFTLPSFIYGTFCWKIVERNPHDHALIVATLEETTTELDTGSTAQHCVTTIHTNNNNNNNNDCSKSKIVGMVELSQQPPSANRNPPAYPLPLWYKRLYCKINKLPPPNGWVTNLLVGPEGRGQGYSKLLMAAAEGVARTWNCTCIHLHCDASTEGGRIPQTLYKTLGYEMVDDPDSPFAWMGSELSTKVYMIDEVALLYFRKEL